MDIKALRKKLKLTQKELSDMVGVSRSAIAQYESKMARPSTSVLVLLSKVFGTDLNEMKQPTPEASEPYRAASSVTTVKKIAELMNRIERNQAAILRATTEVQRRQMAIDRTHDEIKQLLGWKRPPPG
jgi:transcriptional regulator with XRE-family HTH domain